MSASRVARVLTLPSQEATVALGTAIGRALRGGERIALSGELGAGKTRLVQGIAAGLEVRPDEPVVSPTFVLIREYAGRLRLYHIDVYRLQDPADLATLGLPELGEERDAVIAVEWADRFEELRQWSTIAVRLEHVSASERRATIACDAELAGALE